MKTVEALNEDFSSYKVCSGCDCELELDNYTERRCFVCDLPLTIDEETRELMIKKLTTKR